MAEPLAPRPWQHWLLLAALAGLSLMLRLLPLDPMPAGLPGPDLLLCLALAWVLRRPDYAPALLLAAIFLLEDLLLMRPPGLWAGVVVLGAEFLRSRQALLRELGFGAEWGIVALVMTGMVMAERLALSVTMVALPPLGMSVLQLVMSILCYPLVVLLCRYGFGVRKPATGETDALGRPL